MSATVTACANCAARGWTNNNGTTPLVCVDCGTPWPGEPLPDPDEERVEGWTAQHYEWRERSVAAIARAGRVL